MIDISIVGGGVAGLWMLNRFRKLGYDAHLFEKTALGHGQTIACQGVIHSGAKYLLAGGESSGPISLMPSRWRACFQGCGESQGEIDLMSVKILADEIKAFRGGEICPLDNETVVDVKSLIAALREPVADFIYLGEPVPSKVTIYTAGLGNEAFSRQTQRRPLRMFMVKPSPFGSPVYLHCTGKQGKPGMTITTHYLDGEQVLYLGGNVAEKAVGMDDQTAFLWAKSEIQYRFPNFNWNGRQWAYNDVIRAEAANDSEMPHGPRFVPEGLKAVAWPTKLGMTPILADMALEWLESLGMTHNTNRAGLDLPHPGIASYPWESAKWIEL